MNIRKKINLSIAGLAGIFLTGCFPAYLMEMEGLEPAKVTIPSSIQSLTLVTRHDLDSTLRIQWSARSTKTGFEQDSLFFKEAYNGCWDALLESPRFEMRNPVVRRTLKGDFSDPARTLPWSTIRDVAGEPPADGVLVLEACEMTDTIRPVLRDGWNNVYEYQLYTNTFWRFYSINDFYRQEFVFTDTLKMDLYPEDMQAINSVTKLLKREGNYLAGQKSGRKMAPYWTDLERYYFPIGPTGFYLGGVHMRQGNWEEAAKIWDRLVVSKNKYTAAKACYNMAVTCEIAGETYLSLEWLKKSEEKGMPAYLVTDYRSKLRERLKKNELLDKQIN